ncbi:COQ9 family ubiquinone biosynthesis protein [Thioclava dalianensis]|uniref:COQ9 family ubiquinone biosynthesis protein n=1 Tax=Thioclava dalianensis TaxID=1185766 RepID=A0A074TKI0_9RHOB|nr:COQ9 family protein [Thioclava dalianensis]KEP69503.1 COQ9 family ubiquinone biosynthesis protein [Thioclava dalianensis]SFN67801.1 ubiquinone biosynthesis protein COQ9 [Thioclava dalianensis]
MKNDHLDVARARSELLEAIKPNVPFDGWSEPSFQAAVSDLGMDAQLARVICPRGAVDLAVEYHRQGDEAMLKRLSETDLSEMKFRDRIAAAVRFRLEAADPELVRRGAAIFALPQNAATGSKLVWETCDKIWTVLGDQSADYNWYTKRMTLSGVYSATVLYWMGDESEDHADSWAFLDRRIENVMQFEKVKGAAMKLPFLPQILGTIRAPNDRADMPGKETR